MSNTRWTWMRYALVAGVVSTVLMPGPRKVGAMADAQDPPPAADQDGQEAAPPATEQDRGYESRRDKSLERRDRWDTSRAPGHASQTQVTAADAYDRGFEDGFNDGWLAAQRSTRGEQSLAIAHEALAFGAEHFRGGRYGAASRAFMLAATSDQGDAVSRLQAAHSLTALGHYEDAYLLVRRAMQLQPRLPYMPLDIRAEYADDGASFAKHLGELRATTLESTNPHLWVLLGYYHFYSDGHADAYAAFTRAAELDAKDLIVGKLRDVARISVPAK